MANCDSISPKHVDMKAIRSGGKTLNEAYGDIEEIKSELKKAAESLDKRSLQYGEGSQYIIEAFVDQIIETLEKINNNNSSLPREYESIASDQNSKHKAAIAAENNSRRAKAANSIPPRTPDLIVCTNTNS